MLEEVRKLCLLFANFYTLCSFPYKECSPFERYRHADGGCTNLDAPYWGSAHTRLRRLVPNTYNDGISVPRIRGVDGNLLPSPRFVNIKVTRLQIQEPRHSIHTNLFEVFGQFLNHDISFTPTLKDITGKLPKCCSPHLVMNGGQHPDVERGGPCFTIDISPDDPVYRTRCMNFVRSQAVEDRAMKCNSPSREQTNIITSFLDASVIYGSSEDETRHLRSFIKGLMKTGPNNMLPENPNGKCVKRNGTADYCVMAGDTRANVHPGLTSLHTIFVRLHNRIATDLNTMNSRNPVWGDEMIFQETRKIMEGIIQQISVHEWLPLLVGPEITKQYQLNTPSDEYKYLSTLDPSITNVFSTAAFRYGHSSVPNVWTYGKQQILLEDMFLRPYLILDDNGKGLENFVEGMLIDSSQDADNTFSNGLRNKLFQTDIHGGLDLAAINLQRGRDHGLGTYNDYRSLYGLQQIRFNNTTDQVRALATAYRYADDVDIFIGGLTESPVEGGVVGETFANIIGQQFFLLKYGDRLWFENLEPPTQYIRGNPSGFSVDQIKAIRQVTMARILCDTTNIKHVPRQAFVHPNNGESTKKVSCEDHNLLPALDLRAWHQPYMGRAKRKTITIF